MKKFLKIATGIVALAMMFSICSCAEKSQSGSAARGRVYSDEERKPEYGQMPSFSQDTLGSLFQLCSENLGADLSDAEKAIGDFFNTRLEDQTGYVLTDTREDIVTTMHVYVQMLEKDDIRFNGMEIWTDEKEGYVRRISFALQNSDYVTVHIDDTPEFREEILGLGSSINDALTGVAGAPYETGLCAWDEDSPYNYYLISDSCYISVEIRDFTGEGGNDLVSVDLIIADCEILLF